MRYLLLLLISCLLAKPVYKFSELADQNRFNNNLAQYRCLVCQNESLLESHAALAADLRQQIYLMIISGKSDDDIRKILESRYGAFIELSPPLNTHTSILWCLPIILLLLWLFRLNLSR